MTAPDELRIARDDLAATFGEVRHHLQRAEQLLAGLARRRAALARLMQSPAPPHPCEGGVPGGMPPPDAAAGVPRHEDGGGRAPPKRLVPTPPTRSDQRRAPAAAERGGT